MTEQFDFGGEIVWRPSPEHLNKARLTDFMRQHAIHDFSDLMTRSTEDVGWFTESILQYLDIQFYEPYHKVVELSKGIAWDCLLVRNIP